MEQGQRGRAHLERVLLVTGLQNAGKSTLLRRMFVDPRFGTRGVIPTHPRIGFIALSRERCLLLRISSPHEKGETLDQFFKKLDRAMQRAWNFFWRINIACAVQPNATQTTPDLVTICREFNRRLLPERIRVIQIDPRQDGQPGALLSAQEIDQLRSMEVDVMTVDARRPQSTNLFPNGLLLADYFDFT